jgi:hypothetical protein
MTFKDLDIIAPILQALNGKGYKILHQYKSSQFLKYFYEGIYGVLPRPEPVKLLPSLSLSCNYLVRVKR